MKFPWVSNKQFDQLAAEVRYPKLEALLAEYFRYYGEEKGFTICTDRPVIKRRINAFMGDSYAQYFTPEDFQKKFIDPLKLAWATKHGPGTAPPRATPTPRAPKGKKK